MLSHGSETWVSQRMLNKDTGKGRELSKTVIVGIFICPPNLTAVVKSRR